MKYREPTLRIENSITIEKTISVEMSVSVYVTSDLTSSERKFSYQSTVSLLKQTLERVTGIAPTHQTIHVYKTPDSNEYEVLADAHNYSLELDDSVLVGSLGLVPYCRLHVVDENPHSPLKALLSEKLEHEFMMTEDEYKARANTVLAWKTKNQLGRFDPEFETQKAARAKLDHDAIKAMNIGDRCRTINIEGERRGTIRYLGKIDQLDDGESDWVGIEFDEPVGKNNGLIGDLELFKCEPKHGSFVRPQKVEVGDFPSLSDEEL